MTIVPKICSWGKWTRLNCDCQKSNAIYKHLQRRSGKKDIDRIENAKTNFEQRFAAPKNVEL